MADAHDPWPEWLAMPTWIRNELVGVGVSSDQARKMSAEDIFRLAYDRSGGAWSAGTVQSMVRHLDALKA